MNANSLERFVLKCWLIILLIVSTIFLSVESIAQPKNGGRRPQSLEQLKAEPYNYSTNDPTINEMMMANGNNGNSGNSGNTGNNGNGNGNGPPVPIDNGILILLIAGVGLGVYQIKTTKSVTQKKPPF